MSDIKIGLIKLFQSKGLLFPSNADEIIRFEKNLDSDKVIPKNWDNPVDIILRGKQKIHNIEQSEFGSIETQNLAMAAREGKNISSEVRQKMIEDRNNANKK